MKDLQETLSALLRQSATALAAVGVPDEIVGQLKQLAQQVYEPCVLAVVGRVKAGKSTFINALLGEDLAKVGVTETTATINYFRYGRPADPARPVRCHWRGGGYTDCGPEFLDGLQGNDVETLRRADGIDRLEYHLSNPYLENVTLIDTPGTAAVVNEHQNRTAEFLRLHDQLRDRHEHETREQCRQADAVIYLVGEIARTTDRDLLDEFRLATGGQSRAMNAIGVLAKVDRSPALLAQRKHLAAKIAGQLRDSLNTVLPVSAGIRRALDRLLAKDRAGLDRMIRSLQMIPSPRLEKLLDNEEFYLTLDCPVTVAERAELLGNMPWGVFTTIARSMLTCGFDPARGFDHLESVAGFGPLKAVLNSHFFQRGHFLRCHRVASDARGLLNAVRFNQLSILEDRDHDNQRTLQRFQSVVRSARGDPAVVEELVSFLAKQLPTDASQQVEAVLRDLDRQLGRVLHELEEYNADFEALQHIEQHDDCFSRAEVDELRPLLGLYGLEHDKRLPLGMRSADYVMTRQQSWRLIGEQDRTAIRRLVADRAVARYGILLGKLDHRAGGERQFLNQYHESTL